MKSMMAALVLVLLCASTAPAQRTARGGFAGIGFHNADVGEINARLSANGYPTFSDDFLNFSGGFTWWMRNLVLGIDGSALLQPTETNAAYRTSLTGGYGLVSLGLPVRAGRNVMIYPMASVGGGGAQLSIQSRSVVSFDELLQNPGRTADVANGSLLFGPRVGLHYLWRRSEHNGAARGVVFGLRAGYLFSAFEGDWSEIDNETVDGGPSLNLAGPQLVITIGGFGERPRGPRR